MQNRLLPLLDKFADLRVLVIGDCMLDSYVHGASRRLCQEAPVPIVDVEQRRVAPGGAANAAANVAALGARVQLLSVMGADKDGTELKSTLLDHGVPEDGLVVMPGRRTLAKERVQVASQVLLRLDHGDTGPVSEDAEQFLIDRTTEAYPACDAIIVSDYGYGVVTRRLLAALSELRRRLPRLLVVDSKRLTDFRGLKPDAVKPNFCQVQQLLGSTFCNGSRGDWLIERGQTLLDTTGANLVAATLDAEGAIVFKRGALPYRTLARPSPDARAAGAGDTYISSLTLALAAGADHGAAADLAAAAAALVVEKDGTACCSSGELQAALLAHGKAADLPALLSQLRHHRCHGRRVVLTNGCFDILHRGHVSYLSQAKALGDVLVVGVNTDETIRRLKGEGRPINSLEDRMQVLSALQSVDHVIAFAEDTPHRLVQAIRPDIFVKGGDYTRDRLPEAALVEKLGGVVHILPLVESRSTTRLIARIRERERAAASDWPSTNTARREESATLIGGDAIDSYVPSKPALISPSRGDTLAADTTAGGLKGAES